jgi:hypothetical protein
VYLRLFACNNHNFSPPNKDISRAGILIAVISENKTDPKQVLVNPSLSSVIISPDRLLDATLNSILMEINMKKNENINNQIRIAEVLVPLLKRN